MLTRHSTNGSSGTLRWNNAGSAEDSQNPVTVRNSFRSLDGVLTFVKQKDPLVYFGHIGYTLYDARHIDNVRVDPGTTVSIKRGSFVPKAGKSLTFSVWTIATTVAAYACLVRCVRGARESAVRRPISNGYRCRGSDQTTLGKRQRVGAGNDDVIEQAHIDQRQRAFQCVGQHAICGARLRLAGGMVVRLMCPGFLCVRRTRLRRRSAIAALDQGT
jgi:hypothetical protein